MNEPTESCEESELNPILSCGDKVTHCILYSKHIYEVQSVTWGTKPKLILLNFTINSGICGMLFLVLCMACEKEDTFCNKLN